MVKPFHGIFLANTEHSDGGAPTRLKLLGLLKEKTVISRNESCGLERNPELMIMLLEAERYAAGRPQGNVEPAGWQGVSSALVGLTMLTWKRDYAGWMTNIPSYLSLFSSTPPYGAGRCVCACGWEDRVEEGPTAKRRAGHAAAWRSCQDSAAGAATAEAAPAARASDALQVQTSQSEASSTTIAVPHPVAVLLRAAK
ncbi:hypothetical protein LEMLEM_LOCUS12105 [Lemmus lemmus]